LYRLRFIEDDDDVRFLFELLKERPVFANISHKRMPSFKEHKRFVDSHPYYVWFIIWSGNDRVGSVHKQFDGEIGIAVKKEYQKQGVASSIVPCMFVIGNDRNLANVAPGNSMGIGLFRKLGFEHIQNTYEHVGKEETK